MTIQECIVNVHYFPLQVSNEHSCHHNSESDIIDHSGVVISEIHTRDLAETFCHKSGMLHTIMFYLKFPSTPNQSSVLWTVFSIHMSPNSHIQHLLELRQIASCHFSLAIRSGSHQASWKLCGSSGSDIVLVTKAISCNHSFKVFSSFTSANALTSGSDPSYCLVTEVCNLQGVPPTGGEGETMVIP